MNPRRFQIGRSGRISRLSALLLACVAITQSARAATIFVAPSGDDGNSGVQAEPLRTVQAALDRAGAGDTVFLRGGTYNERVQVRQGGSPNDRLTIRSYEDEHPIIDGAGIGGLQFTDALVEIDNHSYVTVKDLEIRNSSRNCLRVAMGTHALIEELEIHGCGQNGMAFYNNSTPSYSVIQNNRIHDVTEGGIFLWENSGGHFLVQGNEIWDVAGTSNHDGIQGNDTPYVVVRHNTVSQVASAGDYIDFGGNQNSASSLAHHIVVDRNTVFRGPGGGSGGMKLNNRPSRVIYRRNVTTQVGFIFYEQPHAEVSLHHNIVLDADEHALVLWNLDSPGTFGGIRIKNNIFSGSTQRMLVHGPNQVDGGTSPILLDGNVYRFGASTGIEWAMNGANNDYGTSVAELNRWRSDTGQEPSGGTWTDLTLSALFADSSAGDFTLAEGSPAIDAGVPLTTTTSAGSGTSVPVAESFHFFDGYDLVEGDWIRIGDQAAWVVDVDEANDRLILDRALTWDAGAGVSLDYQGDAPDPGAREGIPSPPDAPPGGLRRVDDP